MEIPLYWECRKTSTYIYVSTVFSTFTKCGKFLKNQFVDIRSTEGFWIKLTNVSFQNVCFTKTQSREVRLRNCVYFFALTDFFRRARMIVLPSIQCGFRNTEYVFYKTFDDMSDRRSEDMNRIVPRLYRGTNKYINQRSASLKQIYIYIYSDAAGYLEQSLSIGLANRNRFQAASSSYRTYSLVGTIQSLQFLIPIIQSVFWAEFNSVFQMSHFTAARNVASNIVGSNPILLSWKTLFVYKQSFNVLPPQLTKPPANVLQKKKNKGKFTMFVQRISPSSSFVARSSFPLDGIMTTVVNKAGRTTIRGNESQSTTGNYRRNYNRYVHWSNVKPKSIIH